MTATKTWTCLLCVTPDGEPAHAQRAAFLNEAQAATFTERAAFVAHVVEQHGIERATLVDAIAQDAGFLDGSGWTGVMKTFSLNGRPLVSVLRVTSRRKRA